MWGSCLSSLSTLSPWVVLWYIYHILSIVWYVDYQAYFHREAADSTRGWLYLRSRRRIRTEVIRGLRSGWVSAGRIPTTTPTSCLWWSGAAAYGVWHVSTCALITAVFSICKQEVVRNKLFGITGSLCSSFQLYHTKSVQVFFGQTSPHRQNIPV